MVSIKSKTRPLHLTLAPLLILVALLVLAFFFSSTTTFLHPSSSSSSSLVKPHISTIPAASNIHVHQHLQVAHSTCQHTLYPDLCVSTLASFPDLPQRSLPEIISLLVNTTIFEVRDSIKNCSGIRKKLQNLDPLDRRALNDCLELLGDTVAQLKITIADLISNKSAVQHYMDLRTFFSAAITNEYTCLDGFAYSKKKYIRKFIEGRLRRISEHVSNSLAMLKGIKKSRTKKKGRAAEGASFPGEEEFGTAVEGGEGYPKWLKKEDKALLQAPINEMKFDLIVAKDGSGNFTSINDALAAAPSNSKTRFVIYVKAGAYYEYVEVQSGKRMIMLVGDGIGKTLIKGNRSVGDGWTTFRSCTVGTSLQLIITIIILCLSIAYQKR